MVQQTFVRKCIDSEQNYQQILTELTSFMMLEPKPHKHIMGLPHQRFADQPRSSMPLNEKAVATILKGHEEFRLDIFGKIIGSNLEAVNVTGYEEWEIIGKHISMFYPQEDVKTGKVERDLEIARTNVRNSFTSMMIKKRGVMFWAKLSIRSLRDESDSVIGYRVVLKDQNHKLITNTKLKRFKNEYWNLFDNPFIGIFKFRKDDHKILLLNSKAEHIIGNQGVTRFSDIFRHADEFDALLANLDVDKKIAAFEFQLAFGSARWARLDCQWFTDEFFVEGVISDVTESKTQLLELEKLNESLDNFIYRASHDLRSPLTSLMGLINLLETDRKTPSRVYHELMRDRVIHLDQLLGDLAAITYNSKTEVKIERLDLEKMKCQLLNEFGQQACIEFTFSENTVLNSDSDRFFTILRKLTAHSITYHNPARKQHTLRIAIVANDDNAEITLRDDGRGISHDQLPRVFDLFFKPSNDVTDTGLGLYIIKSLVEKLAGTITINSVVGEGTCIRISIPSK